MNRSARLSLLVFSLAIGATVPVRAQDHVVRVEGIACTDDVVAGVELALDVELSNASTEARQALADGSLRAELVCEGDAATARVVRGSEHVEQRVAVSGPAVARRVAITLAELIEASAVPSASPPPPPPPPSPPPPPPPPPPAEAADALRARLRVAAGTWLGGEPFFALGTVELGAELAPTSNVAIVVAAAGAFGAVDVTGARLDLRMVSGAASVRFGGQVDAFWLGAGPAARGGAAIWTGTPSDPLHARGETTTGPWLGLGAVGAAFVRLGELPLRVGIELEGGGIAVYSGALVLGSVGARVGGGWLEARLALDFTFE